MKKKRYLTAKEATEALGITPATLYAYVSRGLIRSESLDEGKRTRRYLAEDVNRLKERKDLRKNPARVTRTALHWGTPLLESALTLITDSGPFYRGYEAGHLALSYSIEQVAALFWTGALDGAHALFAVPSSAESVLQRLSALAVDLPLMKRLTVALTLASLDDLASYDLSPESVAACGARIMRLMAAVLINRAVAGSNLAKSLSAGWCPDIPDGSRLLNAALILCADHELNVSSFTARVVASAETTPYDVVIAGLAALQGLKHGGDTGRVEALIREIGSEDQVRSVLVERLRRGERIPGFGHRLYPDGDPRGRLLLNLAAEHFPETESTQLSRAIAGNVADLIGIPPNIDFGLVTLSRALGLPRGAPLVIFALGRTVGWLGHAIEQYRTGEIIRPRATYVGPPAGITQADEP